MNEIVVISVLFVLSVVLSIAFRRVAHIKLHPIGLVLLWPVVLAFTLGWTIVSKTVGIICLIGAIYFLVQRSKKIQDPVHAQDSKVS